MTYPRWRRRLADALRIIAWSICPPRREAQAPAWTRMKTVGRAPNMSPKDGLWDKRAGDHRRFGRDTVTGGTFKSVKRER